MSKLTLARLIKDHSVIRTYWTVPDYGTRLSGLIPGWLTSFHLGNAEFAQIGTLKPDDRVFLHPSGHRVFKVTPEQFALSWEKMDGTESMSEKQRLRQVNFSMSPEDTNPSGFHLIDNGSLDPYAVANKLKPNRLVPRMPVGIPEGDNMRGAAANASSLTEQELNESLARHNQMIEPTETPERAVTLPYLAGAQYLAVVTKGIDRVENWHYLNHANTWQGFIGPYRVESAINFLSAHSYVCKTVDRVIADNESRDAKAKVAALLTALKDTSIHNLVQEIESRGYRVLNSEDAEKARVADYQEGYRRGWGQALARFARESIHLMNTLQGDCTYGRQDRETPVTTTAEVTPGIESDGHVEGESETWMDSAIAKSDVPFS